MDDLTSRNFQAVKQHIDGLQSKLDAEREARMSLELQVSMLKTAFNEMTQQMAVMRYNQIGRGPTSQG